MKLGVLDYYALNNKADILEEPKLMFLDRGTFINLEDGNCSCQFNRLAKATDKALNTFCSQYTEYTNKTFILNPDCEAHGQAMRKGGCFDRVFRRGWKGTMTEQTFYGIIGSKFRKTSWHIVGETPLYLPKHKLRCESFKESFDLVHGPDMPQFDSMSVEDQMIIALLQCHPNRLKQILSKVPILGPISVQSYDNKLFIVYEGVVGILINNFEVTGMIQKIEVDIPLFQGLDRTKLSTTARKRVVKYFSSGDELQAICTAAEINEEVLEGTNLIMKVVKGFIPYKPTPELLK